ncbi:MAG: acyltransferase family protein [Acidobacteriia bacterium]|nr:acyltransferase family protein [Terriglobia bacterium]
MKTAMSWAHQHSAQGLPFKSPEPRPLDPAASAHLDLIRALAAWAVMWGHLRALFFLNAQQLPSANGLVKILYFLSGFGHQAVMVFFVLSGFLISSSIFRNYALGTWSWRNYFIHRAARLYAVLIPGLLLSLLWDKAGSSLFASSGLYTHPLEDLGSAVAADGLTARDFLGNVFFVQTIFTRTFGSNGPLWSLANEFWYYVLFPVAFFAGLAWAGRSFRRAVSLSGVAVVLMALLGLEKLAGFVVWMAGSALVIAHLRAERLAGRWLSLWLLCSSLAVSACLLLVRMGHFQGAGSDILLGLTFTLFLLGVLQVKLGARNERYQALAGFSAAFSYTLYVVHFPLLLCLRAWLAPSQRWRPDGAHLFYAALIGAAVIVLSWLISLPTEGKTYDLRKWLMHKAIFGGRPRRSRAE